MLKITKLIICMFFFLSINYYCFGQENPLIGKWEVVEGNSKATFEFFKDETCILCVPPNIISKGIYKFSNDNQIEIKLDNPKGNEKIQTFKFSISNEGLLRLTYLNEEDGNEYTTVYKRAQ